MLLFTLKALYFFSTSDDLYFKLLVILSAVMLIFYEEKVEIGVSFVSLLLFIRYNQM